jgi:hypothetical protein
MGSVIDFLADHAVLMLLLFNCVTMLAISSLTQKRPEGHKKVALLVAHPDD